MAPALPGPYYAEIFSLSAHAPHVETRPLKNWTPGGAFGDLETWNATTRPADTALNDYVDVLAPLFPDTYNWSSAIIWYKPDDDTPAVPVSQIGLSQVGTIATPVGLTKAISTTFSFMDSTGGKAKIMLLDNDSRNQFDIVTAFGALTTAEKALVTAFIEPETVFVSRKGKQPLNFRGRTCTHNEKLRREYHMT